MLTVVTVANRDGCPHGNMAAHWLKVDLINAIICSVWHALISPHCPIIKLSPFASPAAASWRLHYFFKMIGKPTVTQWVGNQQANNEMVVRSIHSDSFLHFTFFTLLVVTSFYIGSSIMKLLLAGQSSKWTINWHEMWYTAAAAAGNKTTIDIDMMMMNIVIAPTYMIIELF